MVGTSRWMCWIRLQKLMRSMMSRCWRESVKKAGVGHIDCRLDVGADESRGADRGAIENHATSGGGAVGQFSLCKGYFGGEACGSRLGFSDAEGERAGFGVVELTAEAEPVEVFVERVRVACLARDVRGGSGGRRKRRISSSASSASQLLIARVL